ncbi:MAG TPA: metal-dependent transcriptional regulator [Thermotogota bacterium]|nr:metal-dependent transcriptional regulator [Thermotogota bacterium]HRW93683.1 metal-dependent transcriptional regulator [Thermotogota bacterium]
MPRKKSKVLTPALEEYLKAIYQITRTEPVARVKNIAGLMGVSLPSVTNALKRLDSLGYVRYEKYGLILLSEKGMSRATALNRANSILNTLLTEIVGVEPDNSFRMSCKIDHYFDERVDERINHLLAILQRIRQEGMPACQELQDFLHQDRGMAGEESLN